MSGFKIVNLICLVVMTGFYIYICYTFPGYKIPYLFCLVVVVISNIITLSMKE